MPSNIDELIDMANTESEEFSEFVDEDENSLVEGVDWLKLAVTARTKKYGDHIPTEQKEKAKQLRFYNIAVLMVMFAFKRSTIL